MRRQVPPAPQVARKVRLDSACAKASMADARGCKRAWQPTAVSQLQSLLSGLRSLHKLAIVCRCLCCRQVQVWQLCRRRRPARAAGGCTCPNFSAGKAHRR